MLVINIYILFSRTININKLSVESLLKKNIILFMIFLI